MSLAATTVRTLNRSLLPAALALVAGAASTHAQLIAYEGFDYAAGASLLGQNAGSGFSLPWQTAGFGSWSIDAAGSTYVKNFVQLDTSGKRAGTNSGGYQRNLQLGSPIGNSPGTVWVSFLARHTQGAPGLSWLGLTLPCSGGGNPFLFLGKPFNQSNWGTDAGVGGSIRQTTQGSASQAWIVARLDLRAGTDDVHVWINPDVAGTPLDAAADLTLPNYGNFAGITKILIETGNSGGLPSSGHIDEVRIGGDFAAVAPRKPGYVYKGFEHAAIGAATITPSADERLLTISNIGSSGEDGVAIQLGSMQGGGVVYEGNDTPNAPGSSCRQKYKGWDGTIKGIRDTVTNPDHSMTHTFDYTSMGATSVNVVQYNESDVEISNITYVGGVAVVPMVPPPCPIGSQFPFKVWYDIWHGGTHYLGYYCNDPINPVGMVVVTPIFAPGTTQDMTIDTMEITASGMPELNLAQTMMGGPRESPTRCCRGGQSYRSVPTSSGLGDALIRERCVSSADCTSPGNRALRVENIGSSGQDGVRIDWLGKDAPTSTAGTIDLGDIFTEGGEATMGIRYLFGLRGSTMNVTGTGNGQVEVRPDFTDVGATEFMVVAYLDGRIVGQQTFPNGTPIDVGTEQVICGPGRYPIWGWVTMWVWNPWPTYGSNQTHWGVIGCGSLGTGGGGDPTHFDRLMFRPVNPTVAPTPDTIATASVTASHRDWIQIDSMVSSDLVNCPGDFNADGTADFFDYDDFVSCFEGATCPPNQTSDFNGDGTADFFDYDDFISAFEIAC